MRPSWMSCSATKLAVLAAIAKQIPCAGMIMAVLDAGMTLALRASTSGPPELPGWRAASVWMTSSTRWPDWVRSERPSALTTPAVTVQSKLGTGLPIGDRDLAHVRSAAESAKRLPAASNGAARRDAHALHGQVRVGDHFHVAHEAGHRALAVEQRDGDALGAAHDVAVREHVEARRASTTNPDPLPIPGSGRRTAAAALPRLRPGGAPCTSIFTTEALTCSATGHHRPRIRVSEQFSIINRSNFTAFIVYLRANPSDLLAPIHCREARAPPRRLTLPKATGVGPAGGVSPPASATKRAPTSALDRRTPRCGSGTRAAAVDRRRAARGSSPAPW